MTGMSTDLDISVHSSHIGLSGRGGQLRWGTSVQLALVLDCGPQASVHYAGAQAVLLAHSEDRDSIGADFSQHISHPPHQKPRHYVSSATAFVITIYFLDSSGSGRDCCAGWPGV